MGNRIGKVAFVPFPGEPFADIVLRLRDYSSIENTLSISTANGSIGYIVTRDAYVALEQKMLIISLLQKI